MKKIYIGILIALIGACNHAQSNLNSTTLKSYNYQNLKIPEFFTKLIDNHQNDFYNLDSTAYLSLCNKYILDHKDSTNRRRFYTLHILHKLFTAKDASNGSRGAILNIPYMWHWVSPNPRHQIYATHNHKLLKTAKPSKGFEKYNSYADIDRTPYLYLSDLFTNEPKYYASGCDTFSTFGWCSEREMACVNLMDIYGYEGKVVAEGNHCWSEYWVSMVSVTGTTKHFIVKLDNTFDIVSWTPAEQKNKSSWKVYWGNLAHSKWYNAKAHSAVDKIALLHAPASQNAMNHIEKAVVTYLQK